MCHFVPAGLCRTSSWRVMGGKPQQTNSAGTSTRASVETWLSNDPQLHVKDDFPHLGQRENVLCKFIKVLLSLQ